MRFIPLILLAVVIHPIFAQNLNLNNAQSKLIVKGTSSLHDWSLEATDMGGEINFDLDSVLDIKKLTFFVPVAGLKGSKKGMNKKVQNTLHVKKYDTIDYQLKNLISATLVAKHTYNVKISGILTINGVSKLTDLLFTLDILNKGISITGTKNINMTDYNIKPPRALMGILRTGDAVKVSFNVLYQ